MCFLCLPVYYIVSCNTRYAPNRRIWHLKFQTFSGGNTPVPPRREGATPSRTHPQHGLSAVGTHASKSVPQNPKLPLHPCSSRYTKLIFNKSQLTISFKNHSLYYLLPKLQFIIHHITPRSLSHFDSSNTTELPLLAFTVSSPEDLIATLKFCI